jgi:geranylgeranyl pyrophosphate synthase
MTIGEMVEIAHHGRLVDDPRQYFFLIEKKTASLIGTACEMGAVVGAPGHRATLRSYGHHLGMAFQLIDDLMDYFGEQQVMGKPAGSDLRELQVTYPLLAVLPHLDSAERRVVEALFEDPGDAGPGPDRIDPVIALVRSHGGIEATRLLAGRYAERARNDLRDLPPTPAREALEAAVEYVVARDR